MSKDLKPNYAEFSNPKLAAIYNTTGQHYPQEISDQYSNPKIASLYNQTNQLYPLEKNSI